MNKKLLITAVAGAVALAGCDNLGTGASGDARLSILLTDAPGDFKAAVVTITDIYLQPSEGEDAERVYLRQDSPVTTNLLTLSNDVLTIVEGKTVPDGRYEQLRFVVSGGYIEVETAGGGSTIYATSSSYEGLPAGARVDGTLKCPSCAQTGIKVILNATAGEGGEDDGALSVTGGEQTLLVDFDVSQTFGKQAGRSGMWVMRPTLKATKLETSTSVTVTLAKSAALTLPTLNGTAVTLGSFSATLAPQGGDAKSEPFTDANNDGLFEATFRYLLPGDYQVGVAAPAGVSVTTDPAGPITVQASAASSPKAAFTLTGAAVQ